MRVLVTGATGAFGGPLCTALAARGIQVRAMARHQPASLPAGVHFVAGDVSDAVTVDRAVAGADRVVHLAWLVAVARDPADAERINLQGTRNVLDAMRHHGTESLIFSSSVLAYGAVASHAPFREEDALAPDPLLQYGDHKRIVEEEIAGSGIPAMVARTATVFGRYVGSVSAQIFATPVLVGVAGEDHPWQFIHQDDVIRFLVDRILDGRTGTVNLASDGVVGLERVGELLGRRVLRVPYSVLRAGIGALWKLHLSDANPVALETLRWFPVADTERLRRDWKFQCAWATEETVIDTRRAITGINVLGNLVIPRRGAPPLPPVGGARPGPLAPPLPGGAATAVTSAFGAELATSPLIKELAGTAAASVRRLRTGRSAERAATWAERESSWILTGWDSGRDDDDDRARCRLRQLSDTAIDLLALASGTNAFPGPCGRLQDAAVAVLGTLKTQLDDRGLRLTRAGVVQDPGDIWRLELAAAVPPAGAP